MPYHVDMLAELINQYKVSKKSSTEFLDLAREVANGLAYFPIPFGDIMNLIQPSIAEENLAVFDLIKTNTIQKAASATAKAILQPVDAQRIAKSLLSTMSTELATFSFNGSNSNTIIFNSKYDSSAIRVAYSIDGGINWIETDEHAIRLSDEQVATITAQNDIKNKLMGSNEIYTIDIKVGTAPTANVLQVNDFENEYIGNIENLEYSVDGGETWKAYQLHEKIKGDVVTYARYAAHGTYVVSDKARYTLKKILKISSTVIFLFMI